MSTNRRAPLASIPHATNSPHRILAQAGTKRARQVIHQENEPPLKKQILDKATEENANLTPRRLLPPPSTAEGRVFESGNTNGPPNAFARKLVAARENKSRVRTARQERPYPETQDANRPATTVRVTKVERASVDNTEEVRLWQKHYRKVFPTFVFYFESIPEETRHKCSRQIASLGAQEEKFFSRYVTHVVTTRPIPSENDATSPVDETPSGESQITTINPSLLDKANGGSILRRDNVSNTDILFRARQMGMKIWALEKLQRMITAIANGPDAQPGLNGRVNPLTGSTKTKDEDLSQLLRKERMNGPADRDPLAAAKDTIPFRGPFILIRDIDEKHKPVMFREYPKVSKRQDGAWPQFRSAPIGKCPFLDDPQTQKEWEKEAQKEEKERQKTALKERSENKARITRSVAAETQRADQNLQEVETDAPKCLETCHSRTQSQSTVSEERFPTPSVVENGTERQLPQPSPKPSSLAPPTFVRPPRMHFSHEPAASGLQRSVTSAIRSQMISSTAAAPGAKAGLSKEVHELKRKVLEKNNGSLSAGSVSSSYRTTDLAGQLKNARAPAPRRAAKSKAQEKLGGIQEEDYCSEDELAMPQPKSKPKKKAVKRDPKPGYCENCRDRFDDFEEHTMSRKHRKFATTPSNWTELDALLKILQTT